MTSKIRGNKGFSLVELMLVMGIISLIASLLLPVCMTVRGKARQAVCASNLHQIGLSTTMYLQDNDDYYPYATDPGDRALPFRWTNYPDFSADIPHINLIQDALAPYYSGAQVFHCPSDTGFEVLDFLKAPLEAWPSSYEKYKTSYYYRTELAARHASTTLIQSPSKINMLLDGVGNWHGTLFPLEQRYNVLFVDGHVKNMTYGQVQQAWLEPF